MVFNYEEQKKWMFATAGGKREEKRHRRGQVNGGLRPLDECVLLGEKKCFVVQNVPSECPERDGHLVTETSGSQGAVRRNFTQLFPILAERTKMGEGNRPHPCGRTKKKGGKGENLPKN